MIMTGNSFGKLFKITTWGESHGKAVGVVVDGCPCNVEIDKKEIQKELDRRKPGQSKSTTQRKEEDRVEILSGLFNGKTTGMPISLIVENKDKDSSKYEKIKDTFRPGHADFSYEKKYGIRDFKGGGRSSGRETIGRVAAGAIAKKILKKEDVRIFGFTKQIGNIKAKDIDFEVIENNSVRCPDEKKAKEMEKIIENVKEEGDSIGGVAEIIVRNCPTGLGDPVFDKLDAELSKALMSIGAVKGVEFGSGFSVANRKASENNDEMNRNGFVSNNAGGILGGISTGQDIVIRIAVKPTPSIFKKQKTVDKNGKEKEIKIKGRHDPCIVPRIVPVAESMAALALVDRFLIQRSLGKT